MGQSARFVEVRTCLTVDATKLPLPKASAWEIGGPFEVALVDPKESAEAEALIEDHRMVDARLCRLLAEMDGVRMPELSVQQCFDSEIRSVIEQLFEHETNERALFARISNVSA